MLYKFIPGRKPISCCAGLSRIAQVYPGSRKRKIIFNRIIRAGIPQASVIGALKSYRLFSCRKSILQRDTGMCVSSGTIRRMREFYPSPGIDIIFPHHPPHIQIHPFIGFSDGIVSDCYNSCSPQPQFLMDQKRRYIVFICKRTKHLKATVLFQHPADIIQKTCQFFTSCKPVLKIPDPLLYIFRICVF